MPPISAVIITYNEEKNIKRCIDSLNGVADEILVVDSYSTDQTPEICQSIGVRFLQHPFQGYTEQKNWATSQASFPHVLSLDADEALSDELKKSILAVKENWTHQAYSFNRLTNYCGTWIRHCGWYPDKKIRLFDKRYGRWEGHAIHERYVPQNPNDVCHLKGDLLHYSYYSLHDHILQLDKFTTLGAKAAYEKGKRSSIWLIIFSPLWKFVRDYFFKRGFLDGYHGFVVCVVSAFATFAKYVKLRALEKNEIS